MGPEHAADVLIVSLGSTEGLRRADAELQDSMRRAGASVATVSPAAPGELHTMMLTDLAWARAARAAARRALARRSSPPAAVIYSSTTAALLWPCPGAVRFDAPSAGNRPGRHGLWQRPLERRRLGAAPLLLPWSEGALREAPPAAWRGERALVLPVPVEPSAAPAMPEGTAAGATAAAERKDVAALTYAANPRKKGLDRVLEAWRRVRGEGHAHDADELLVAGTSEHELRRAGLHPEREAGVRVLGPISSAEYRALVRRARVFVCAPRREDYGIAQLEALADGCLLVTTPAPGPYAALPIARSLDARLVAEDLAGALRCALSDPRADYAERARAALLPFSRSAVDRVVAEQLLPRLLP
jgi:glycosyltransferase involved in cell wall biosynthesis